MTTTAKLTNEQIAYELAKEFAIDEVKFDKDTGYGCGSSFVTLKWGKFVREMKKLGLVKKDGYYGWVLDTDEPVNGTLEQEKYNRAFAESLNSQGIHAFVHTYLT